MKTLFENLGRKTNLCSVAVIALAICGIICTSETMAASAKRSSSTPVRSAPRNSKAAAPAQKAPKAAEPEPVTVEEPADTEDTEDFVIEDKSLQFAITLNDTGVADPTGNSDLAEMIKRQRAAFAANDAADLVETTMRNSMAANANKCDTQLRECMANKCGADFTKCATDGDTVWGDKIDACRRDTTCTGHEFTVFSREIKADRDLNVQLAGYNEIINCGNDYNKCIVSKCGNTYNKCLGKAAADKAVADCAKIANQCKQADSGLAARVTDVIATLRQGAEIQVATDEKRLQELYDKMASTCKQLGAMFDDRTLDCVYTVNFFANNSTTPYASKKAYAGGTFNCNQNWFGIDVTTFKENAYRLTRAQTSASAAMLGSGVGTGVGAITSGAIDRAIDRSKAKKALDEANEQEGGDDSNDNKGLFKRNKKNDKTSTQGGGSNTSSGSGSGSNGSSSSSGGSAGKQLVQILKNNVTAEQFASLINGEDLESLDAQGMLAKVSQVKSQYVDDPELNAILDNFITDFDKKEVPQNAVANGGDQNSKDKS